MRASYNRLRWWETVLYVVCVVITCALVAIGFSCVVGMVR